MMLSIFSNFIDRHKKHLFLFLDIIRQNGLVVLVKNIKLFQNNLRFLCYDISEKKKLDPSIGSSNLLTKFLILFLIKISC